MKLPLSLCAASLLLSGMGALAQEQATTTQPASKEMGLLHRDLPGVSVGELAFPEGTDVKDELFAGEQQADKARRFRNSKGFRVLEDGQGSHDGIDVPRKDIMVEEQDKQGAVAGLVNRGGRRDGGKDLVVEEQDKQGAVAGLVNRGGRRGGGKDVVVAEEAEADKQGATAGLVGGVRGSRDRDGNKEAVLEEADKQGAVAGLVKGGRRGGKDVVVAEEAEADKQGATAGLVRPRGPPDVPRKDLDLTEEADKQGAVAGLVKGGRGSRDGPRNLVEEADKRAGAVAGLVRGGRRGGKDVVVEEEQDKQGAVAGLVKGGRGSRDGPRNLVEEADKQGAVAGLVKGGRRNGGRNLRATV